MVHTYEVFVDVKECHEQSNICDRGGTTRYEIDAESYTLANSTARSQARLDHPRSTEYQVRVTRLLR